jgi:hypothetical protein|tara:strand:+ start:1058 stop:1429 length:372 start_codon:yes stop_codon:yes gene_type:complete
MRKVIRKLTGRNQLETQFWTGSGFSDNVLFAKILTSHRQAEAEQIKALKHENDPSRFALNERVNSVILVDFTDTSSEDSFKSDYQSKKTRTERTSVDVVETREINTPSIEQQRLYLNQQQSSS